MIDVFYRVRGPQELMHPRVRVTTAPDTERAQDMIEILNDSLPVDGALAPAGGRPSRRRGTVAQLLARRDAAIKEKPSAKVRLVASREA